MVSKWTHSKYAELNDGDFPEASDLGYAQGGGTGELADPTVLGSEIEFAQISDWENSICSTESGFIYLQIASPGDVFNYVEIDFMYVGNQLESVCHYSYETSSGEIGTDDILPGCYNSLNYVDLTPYDELEAKSCAG